MGWKGSLEIIESNPLPKQVPYSTLHRKMSLEYVQKRFHNPLGSLFHCFVTLTVKKFLHTLVWNFLHFSLWPFLLILI